MENSAPSKVWTYNTHLQVDLVSIMKKNSLKFMYSLDAILFYNFYSYLMQ